MLGTEPRGRHPAGDERLEVAAAGDATAEGGVEHEVAERRLHHLDLVHAGIADVAGQGEQARPGGATRPQGGEGLGTVEHHPGQVGQRLHVVDHGGLAVEADGGREVGRLDAGEAALALEALEQGRLLAADVGPGAGMHHHVDREPRPEDVLAHRAVLVGFVERALDALEPEGELAAHVDEGARRLDGVGGDEHALDELMGVALDQQVVLEGGGLALVAVDHQVGGRRLAQHRPLATGREPGSAPTEQAHGVDLVGDLLGGHGERLAQTFVSPRGQVTLQRVRVLVPETRRDDAGSLGDRHHDPPSARAADGGALGPDGGVVDAQAALTAHPHQRAVPGDVVGQGPGPQPVDEGVEGLGRDVTDEAMVHGQARGPAAVGDALGLLEREHAVCGGRPRPDPE